MTISYHIPADCLSARRGIQVCHMQSISTCHDDTASRAERSLRAVKVEITSGDTGTRYYELRNTASFIGSDQECDIRLADDCFPPIYAFLLLHPKGVVLRHLGQGPEISVDGQSTRRLLITSAAHIVAGPFSFLLQVSPNATRHAEAPTVHEAGKPSSEDRPVKLIEQASRLLSQIQEQAGHKNSLSHGPPKFPENRPASGLLAVSPVSLNLSLGLPPTGSAAPQWNHLCL